MNPQILTIIFVIVAAIAGYVFGLLDKSFTASLRKKPEEAAPAEDQPAREANRPGEHTVLKVTVDQDLKWHLELDGKRIDKPEETSPEQRQRAVNVVVQMRPWMDAKNAPATPLALAPAAPLPEAPITTPLPAPRPSIPQPAASLPKPVPAPASKDDLKISPLRGLRSLVSKDVTAAAEKKPASIVSMIDEVLQANLPGTAYQGKGIRLEDSPQGGVMVVVGPQSYTDIDSVPDPEIRNLIRAAIAEWEKK